MSHSDDLDWLARNVHEWRAGDHQPWCYVYWKSGKREVSGNCITVIQPCVKIEKSQWLARRAEFQNKPNWNLSPSWALHLAQDQDGEWKWLGDNVSQYVDGWTAGKVRAQCKGAVLGDWRDTLEQQPKEFQLFTGIEDNQEKVMKHDNGWHDRGELPPVGIKCEFNAGPFGWFVCDIVAHYNGDAVFAHEEDVSRGKPGEFRPIRTERDEAIKAMKAHCPYPGSWETTYRLFAEALYDAGYRAGCSE